MGELRLPFFDYKEQFVGAFSVLSTTHLSRKRKSLNEDFSYTDDAFGEIKVSARFITDFASIGVLRFIAPILFALLADYGDKASTIHDWLYRGYGIRRKNSTRIYYPTREEADQIFYRALRDEGVARWRAVIFYAGVRLFGRSSFVDRQNVFNA